MGSYYFINILCEQWFIWNYKHFEYRDININATGNIKNLSSEGRQLSQMQYWW